jgi:hypothetical protein
MTIKNYLFFAIINYNLLYLVINYLILLTLLYTLNLKIKFCDLFSVEYLRNSNKLYVLHDHHFLKLSYTFQEYSKNELSDWVVLNLFLSCIFYSLLYIKKNLTKNISFYLINLYVPLKLNSFYKKNPRFFHLKTGFFGDFLFYSYSLNKSIIYSLVNSIIKKTFSNLIRKKILITHNF